MKYLDFYGFSYNLRTVGQSCFKTKLSILSSFISVVLIGVSAYLMGKDFFYKTNPKIIQSTLLPKVTEPVFVNNRNFTFAFRIEKDYNTASTEEELYAYPHFFYYSLKTTDKGQEAFHKIYSPTPCLETHPYSKETLASYKPETLFCLNFNQIKQDLNISTDVPLYGDWTEENISMIHLIFSNCPFKNGEIQADKCISHEEALKRSAKTQYMSIYVPKVQFNPEDFDNPVSVYYDNVYFKMSPFTDFSYYMRYSLFRLNDDRGWIFTDLKQTSLSELADERREYRFLSKETFSAGKADMVTIDLTFQRKQIRIKRVFTKIQEFAANLGGIIKVILLVFGGLNQVYSNFKVTKVLVKEASESIETVKEAEKLSFKQYLLIQLGFGVPNNLVEEVERRLDVRNLLFIQRKSSELANVSREIDSINVVRAELTYFLIITFIFPLI